MLQQLEISNVALIDHVNIEFGKGLNILTGETGAGKSIIIDSINAVLGERFSKDLIRTGTDRAIVEAVFQANGGRLAEVMENTGIQPEEDGMLIISREFSSSGRNTCRVNGRLVTATVLKELGEQIVDMHGQHDNQSLLNTENHMKLLDSFGGESIQTLKQEYNGLLSEYTELKKKLKELSGDKNERERKIDLYKYQIDEIKKAKLKFNEEEELEKKRILYSNAGKIIHCLSEAYNLLFSGSSAGKSVFDGIGRAIAEINGIAGLDEKFERLALKLEDISYQLEDVIGEMRKERDATEFNPALLEKTEERIDLIFRLKKKYGNTVCEILEYCKKAEDELEIIINSEAKANDLLKKLKEKETRMYETAEKLHRERENAAKLLESMVEKELDDLEMKRVRFKVDVEFSGIRDNNAKEDNCGGEEKKFSKNGLDKIEFLISPNVGEPLKPLSKIASGGEMSRIMLAIKTILAKEDNMPVLIFDEVDSGVGGKAAHKIGEKLFYISKNHQVICVTHLAQIACMADNHYLIEKKIEGNNTKTFVKKLEHEDIKQEIARMLGGASISEITLKHAEEMIKTAQALK